MTDRNMTDKLMTERITLAHGSGGRMMTELIDEIIRPILTNPILDQGLDSAQFELAPGLFAMTTDSYVVKPLFFPGGSIGSLAVHGTLNDLAMSGARGLYLTLGLILEEGLPLADLRQALEDLRRAADQAGVAIVTGDTKVVERGKGDGIYCNTAGLGIREVGALMGPEAVQPGDLVLLSGSIADHGLCILIEREGLELESPIRSDSANLYPLVEVMLKASSQIRILKDPTRGGLSACMNEVASLLGRDIILSEGEIPLHPATESAARLLGIDPLQVANEGKLIAVAPPEEAQSLLKAMQGHELGREARIIGEVAEGEKGRVILQTKVGGKRVIESPLAEALPRIC